MRRFLLCGALGGTLLSAFASAAVAGSYRASFSADQEVSWSVDGTRGSCEIRRGTGSGTVKFHVASSKAAPVTAGRSGGRLSFVGSVPSVGQGTIAGAFTDALETPCEGQEPEPSRTEPSDGCGATKFGVRVDFVAKGAFVYVTGPETPLAPSLAQLSGECPFPTSGTFLDSTDFAPCGDAPEVFRRSWGVASANGQGLLASRFHLTPRQLPKGKRKRRYSKRTAIDCTMASSYTGGVHITGTLQYTLTLKRL